MIKKKKEKRGRKKVEKKCFFFHGFFFIGKLIGFFCVPFRSGFSSCRFSFLLLPFFRSYIDIVSSIQKDSKERKVRGFFLVEVFFGRETSALESKVLRELRLFRFFARDQRDPCGLVRAVPYVSGPGSTVFSGSFGGVLAKHFGFFFFGINYE